MSTHNICFHEDLTKIIFDLSSNTHLISSAESYVHTAPGQFPWGRLPVQSLHSIALNCHVSCQGDSNEHPQHRFS